jgi:hypothetical protein
MVATLHGTVLNYDQYTADESSNYSVFSSSFSNVDGTNLVLDIHIDAKAQTGQALIGFHGNVAVPSSQTGFFNLLVNGTLNAANDGIIFAPEGSQPIAFTRLVTGLVVGTLNRVYLQAKVTGGTMTVYAGAGTGNADVHPQLWSLVL